MVSCLVFPQSSLAFAFAFAWLFLFYLSYCIKTPNLDPVLHIFYMEDSKEGNGRRFSLPAFGEWEGKVGMPDYSVDFSRIREHRRQNKSRVSLGNEEELLNSTTINGDHSSEPLKNTGPHHQRHGASSMTRKKISRYFNCYGCSGA